MNMQVLAVFLVLLGLISFIAGLVGLLIVVLQKKQKKPWLIASGVGIVLFILGIAVVAGGTGSSSSDKADNPTTSKSLSKSTVAKGNTTSKESNSSSSESTQTIDFGYEKHPILDQATYPVQWSDNTWAGTQVKVDKVQIIKTKPFKDDATGKMYAGVVLMHFGITASRDISIYPSQGTLVTSDGQQSSADTLNGEDFDGDIAKGVSRDGYVLWELEKMDDPKAIKTLRVKFDANYETDDMDDDNSDKTYDFTINI
jgi:hypothetical protein